MNTVKVFTTSGSEPIAKDVCSSLATRLPRELQPEDGLSLGNDSIASFSNENVEAQAKESVRGCFTVVIHSQVPPVNQNLVEMIALVDAIRGAHSADILLVFPYMPYSRSDRKNKPRISVMAKRLAKIINLSLGIEKVLLLDPHDTHIKHYFDPDADEISAIYLLAHDMRQNISDNFPRDGFSLVFADLGAANRFSPLPKLLDLDEWAIINKYRDDDSEETHIRGVIGNIKDRHCVLFDDESLTGGTAIQDSAYLLEHGAKSVTVYAIHPPLHKKNIGDDVLIETLENSPVKQFVFTDSIPIKQKIKRPNSKIRVVTVAPLLAEAVSRIVQNRSLTALHNPDRVSLYLK